MDPKDVGTRLLGSIKSSTLSESLKYVRRISRAHESRPLFGFPELDALLPPNNIIDVDQLDASTQYDSEDQVIEAVLRKIDTRPFSNIVELTSSEACSGKSLLLQSIVANGVLPVKDAHGQTRHGSGMVIVLDTDNRLDVVRLQETIRGLLRDKVTPEADKIYQSRTNQRMITDKEAEDIVNNALQRILLFRPRTFGALTATLDDLPAYLARNAPQHAVHAIILDSASAFYWQIKAEQDAHSLEALDARPENGSRRTKGPTSTFTGLARKLSYLSDLFECPVIATTWNSSVSAKTTAHSLNPALPCAPAARLEVERASVRRFADQASIDAAQALKPSRAEAVVRHDFHVTSMNSSVSVSLRSGYVQSSEHLSGT